MKKQLSATEKEEIVRISKEFASGFKPLLPKIEGSGFLIVDPLSAYLQSIGIPNTLHELPATDERNQILIITFSDGSQLIPAGADLKYKFPDAENWLWL